MAVIVRHKENKQVYVLVGSSYSYYKDSRPSFLGGNLFPDEEEGLFDQVAVADETGNIQWFPTDQIEVIEVDGKEIKNILASYKSQLQDLTEKVNEAGYDNCPGCGYKVKEDERHCPSCGLTLILEE